MTKKARKKLRLEIAATLSTTFTGLTKNLSEKKFQRNVRRASRILVDGVKPESDNKLNPKKASKKKQVLTVIEKVG
jgi:Na+-translocating ferredoxin:NAD+ oxidoreductase RnfG subunit